MTPSLEHSLCEAQIRRLMNDWADAVRAKDVNRAVSHYGPGVRVFDVVDPLQTRGVESARKRAQEWFSSFEGDLGFEVAQMSIEGNEDVAFCHCLNHVTGKTKGGPIDMWWRATVCFHKNNGCWLVAHEHHSVPFDPATGKASLGLTP